MISNFDSKDEVTPNNNQINPSTVDFKQLAIKKESTNQFGSFDKSKQTYKVVPDNYQEQEVKEYIHEKEKFKAVTDQFTEMIAFLDFSFERAFTKKEKDFMLAYKQHIDKVQDEINELKNESNDQKFMSIKQQKIAVLEQKLAKIRESALFLGDMSEMHRKKIKQMKLKVGEDDQDKQFMEKQIEKVRNQNKNIKTRLSKASAEYDDLYKQAQDFIQNSDDKEKINELLQLLDDSQREQIMQETAAAEELKQKYNPTEGTGGVLIDYNNTKLTNFIQTLWDMGMSKQQFSNEIERYFFNYSIRKTNIQSQLVNQIQHEKDRRQQILNKHAFNEENNGISSNSINGSITNQQASGASELYGILLEEIELMKEDLRQRKTLSKLQNMKSVKMRADQIDVPSINSITISQFKSQDKKKLLESFLTNERVIQIINNIIGQMQNKQQQQQNNIKMQQSRMMRPLTSHTEGGNGINRAQNSTFISNQQNNNSFLNYTNNNNISVYDRILNESVDNLIMPQPPQLGATSKMNRPHSQYNYSKLNSQKISSQQKQQQQFFNPQFYYSGAGSVPGGINGVDNQSQRDANNSSQAIEQKKRPQSSSPFGIARPFTANRRANYLAGRPITANKYR